MVVAIQGDESVDKQPEEAPLVKATGKSSKYLASSLFSSGPGSGEPEKAIGQFQDWLHSHRFLFIGGWALPAPPSAPPQPPTPPLFSLCARKGLPLGQLDSDKSAIPFS